MDALLAELFLERPEPPVPADGPTARNLATSTSCSRTTPTRADPGPTASDRRRPKAPAGEGTGRLRLGPGTPAPAGQAPVVGASQLTATAKAAHRAAIVSGRARPTRRTSRLRATS